MPVLFFRAYIRRIAAFLLTMSDRDDRKGLSRPVIINEPRYACI